MSDIGACGVVIHDFIEYLNMKYYCEDSLMVKSHIGFGLIMLKDLVDLIECKEDLPIDVYESLQDIRFYRHQSEVEELIKETLKNRE